MSNGDYYSPLPIYARIYNVEVWACGSGGRLWQGRIGPASYRVELGGLPQLMSIWAIIL